jgi:hypothetical protein
LVEAVVCSEGSAALERLGLPALVVLSLGEMAAACKGILERELNEPEA